MPTGCCPTTCDVAAHHHRADDPADDRTRHSADVLGRPFIKFILTEIFPGGYLPTIELVGEHAGKAGFTHSRVSSRCSRTMRAPWISGQPRSRRTRTRPSRSSRRGLRPLHALPDRVRGFVPQGLHRRQPIHVGQAALSGLARIWAHPIAERPRSVFTGRLCAVWVRSGHDLRCGIGRGPLEVESPRKSGRRKTCLTTPPALRI